jgi:hypothetical protein
LGNQQDHEIEAIKKVIQEAVVDGFLNLPDLKIMRKGIHSDFINLNISDNKLTKTKLNNWLESAETRKRDNPGGRKTKVTVKFLSVEAVDDIGFAEVEFYVGTPELHGTDFFLLLKFQDGWKLVRSIDQHFIKESDEKKSIECNAIEKILDESYIDGYLNSKNSKSVENGFHPEFNGLFVKNNVLEKSQINNQQIDTGRTDKSESKKNYQELSAKFSSIKVIGRIGFAKCEIYKGFENHVTEYILLLRFDEGWKLVTKISHNHLL